MTFKRSICVKIFFLATILNAHPSPNRIDLEAERMIDNLANLQFDQLGSPQIKSDSIKPVLAPVDRPHRLLVIAVEFPEIATNASPGIKNRTAKTATIFRSYFLVAALNAPSPGPSPITTVISQKASTTLPAILCRSPRSTNL